MELDAIAAVVLGGTSFTGEGGSMLGTLFGALIMGTVSSGLNISGVDPYVQSIFKGAIIIGAVLVGGLKARGNET
jgi:ribose/xylose/arabinose/galactoside ABC-type transport system permease subunit